MFLKGFLIKNIRSFRAKNDTILSENPSRLDRFFKGRTVFYLKNCSPLEKPIGAFRNLPKTWIFLLRIPVYFFLRKLLI